MDGLFLLLRILFSFAFTLTEIWKLEMPSACIQRDPLPCSTEAASVPPYLLPAPSSVSSSYSNTGSRKGRASSWNMGSVQHLDPENGKPTVPQEERGCVAVSGGRNLIQACRVNKLQPHPCVWRVRTFRAGRGREILTLTVLE